MGREDRCLTRDNVHDIVCCPGGLEIRGKNLTGEIQHTITWRMEMLERGMAGFVSYQEGVARGFIEYMPAETAPLPVEAPGAAAILCYHWVPEKEDEREHLAEEERLLRLAVEAAQRRFSGVVTLGWDHPTHFPIELLRALGFREVERHDYLALMWLPFRADARPPELAPPNFQPRDLAREGLLALEVGFSHRCPYSIHHAARVERVLAELPAPARAKVQAAFHVIDSRADGLRFCRHPWDWMWVFLNGRAVEYWKTTSEDLKRTIQENLDKLEGP